MNYAVSVELYEGPDEYNNKFSDMVTCAKIEREEWRVAGVTHADNRPAVIIRDIETNEVIVREWYQHGLLHRIGQPARWMKCSSFTLEMWYVNGKECRVNGPSLFARNGAGMIIREDWNGPNGRHREGGPAYLYRDETTGVVIEESWAKNGNSHREDGPAIIERCAWTGIITREEWLIEGKYHRANGPAIVSRDEETGAVMEQRYFNMDVEINPSKMTKDWRP